MKMLLTSLLALALFPLYGEEVPRESASELRPPYFGVVADEHYSPAQGETPASYRLVVTAVAPGSPALKAGLQAGDKVLSVDGVALGTRRALIELLEGRKAGDILRVLVLRRGVQVECRVELTERAPRRAKGAEEAVSLVGERALSPVSVSPEIRRRMAAVRRRLLRQLSYLPDDLEPMAVTRDLQEIRNLARDTQAQRGGWMSGQAGEASVRFRDDEGSIVLRGADNRVSLEVYDHENRLIYQCDLMLQATRRTIPESIIQRVHRLR